MITALTDISGYHHPGSAFDCSHDYLLPAIAQELDRLNISPKRVFDLGCGNGVIGHWFAGQGFEVAGVDPSESGIEQAHKGFPSLDLRQGSAYDPLHETFGTFPLVISLEVVEHVYAPRKYAACIRDLLTPGGYAVISTPYHGYLKNLLLAASGKLDSHFTALWDHGHIKFWSRKTITTLLSEAGMTVQRIRRVGRVPSLAKSMLVVARNRW